MQKTMFGNIAKKAVSVLAAASIALAGSLAIASLPAEDAHAATKPYMKTLKVKWDLKKNKPVTFKTAWAGAGFQKMTATVKNYKVRNAKKKGYKTATFTIVYKNLFNPTKSQRAKMEKFGGNWNDTNWGNEWYAIVDKSTGKCLEKKNSKHVTVKSTWSLGRGEYSNFYVSDYGTTVHAFKTIQAKVSVTYPKSYKGLCLGVGGYNAYYNTTGQDLPTKNPVDALDSFWKGNAKFGKTSLYDWNCAAKYHKGQYKYVENGLCYKGSKTNSHWMEIK